MIVMDEIADILKCECKHRGISRVVQITGIKKGKIYNIINGCNFVVNAELIAGLKALGYDIDIKESGNDRRT